MTYKTDNALPWEVFCVKHTLQLDARAHNIGMCDIFHMLQTGLRYVGCMPSGKLRH
jgi:hypothetical protein